MIDVSSNVNILYLDEKNLRKSKIGFHSFLLQKLSINGIYSNGFVEHACKLLNLNKLSDSKKKYFSDSRRYAF